MTGQPNASLACRRARNLGPWFFAFWLFLAACGFGAPVSQDAQTVARTDIGGRLTRIDRPNGTWRKMIYDAAGQLRLAEEHEPGVNGALIWLQNLRYDKVGSDFNVNENDGEITWTFTAPTPAGFSLPADTATYDADNQGGSKRVRSGRKQKGEEAKGSGRFLSFFELRGREAPDRREACRDDCGWSKRVVSIT